MRLARGLCIVVRASVCLVVPRAWFVDVRFSRILLGGWWRGGVAAGGGVSLSCVVLRLYLIVWSRFT